MRVRPIYPIKSMSMQLTSVLGYSKEYHNFNVIIVFAMATFGVFVFLFVRIHHDKFKHFSWPQIESSERSLKHYFFFILLATISEIIVNQLT